MAGWHYAKVKLIRSAVFKQKVNTSIGTYHSGRGRVLSNLQRSSQRGYCGKGVRVALSICVAWRRLHGDAMPIVASPRAAASANERCDLSDASRVIQRLFTDNGAQGWRSTYAKSCVSRCQGYAKQTRIIQCGFQCDVNWSWLQSRTTVLSVKVSGHKS